VVNAAQIYFCYLNGLHLNAFFHKKANMHLTEQDLKKSEDVKGTIPLYRTILIVGVVLVVIKFLAWWITNSHAILSDALESIVNVLAGGFGLFALYFSARPRSASFPYGHGKIEFLSGGFEGTLIIIAGLFLMIKGSYDLYSPRELVKLDTGLLLTLGTGITHGLMAALLLKRGKVNDSLIYQATGKHLLSDMLTTFAIVFGLGIVWLTGWVMLDSLIGIVFGAYIAWMGIKLVRQAVSGILDEAPGKLIAEMIDLMNEHRRPRWIDIHNFRFIRFGKTLHIDCHMTLPWYLTVKEAHDEMDHLQSIFEQVGGKEWHVEVFIHQDPCIVEACKFCTINDCPVRKEPFREKIKWDIKRLTEDRKHALSSDKM